MEQYASMYYAATWLATVAILLFAYHLRRSTKLNLPPGPKPLPIIGNLDIMGSLPLSTIHELSKKYGEIMHLKLGSKNVVIASSADMAKVFLKTMDAKFSCRPKFMAGKYTSYNYSGIVLSPSGPYLRQARKMCTVELFSEKRLEWYEYIRVDEMKLLLKAVHKSSGEEIMLKDVLSTLSLNVISRMVLGKTYLDQSEEIYKMLNELSFLYSVLNIGDWIPWMSFMDIQGYVKRMKEVSKKFDRFLEQVLNDHDARRKAEGGNFVPSDMVDVLLQVANDPTLDLKLERHGVKAVTQDLLIGGIEGSVVTVETAILQLLKKPEILKNVSEELDRVIGRNRWVEEKDIPNLPYIMAIAKETMRLHPVTVPPPMNKMEQLLAVQNAISQGEELIQEGNVVLLKIRGLLLSIFPQASNRFAAALVAFALFMTIIPFRFVLLLTFLEEFTKYSPMRRAQTERFMRRMREWWFSIPAAPVVLEGALDDKKKKSAPAREDCKVAGYDIPKDTIVFVNVWTIGRDPQLWDKPEEFCPERFIGKEINIKGNNFELLPFGAGRRMCLGCNLGLKVIESSLANLLHGFSWKLPRKMTRDDSHMEEITGLSTDPLVTIAHPRLQPEMYFL